MNNPQTRPGKLKPDETRYLTLSGGYRTAMIDGEQTILGSTVIEDLAVPIHRNSAIELARAILVAYDVPFCNRVKGAGTRASVEDRDSV